jgi:four helix bundle protein
MQFYHVASGSVAELQTQLMLSHDAGYISKADFQDIIEVSVRAHKLIYGLIRSTRS